MRPAFLAIIALVAAGAAAAGVPAPIVETGFLTPSGNIACNAGHASGSATPLLDCTVFSAASRSRGQKVWAMEANGRVSVGYILGNAATDFRPLAYGATWRWRGFRCTSASTGLTCRNRQGHGFFLSRASQRVF